MNPSNWISHDRPVAAEGEADGGADDAGLGERGVHDAVVAEVALQPVGDPEHSAERADVLAHEHDLGVVLERAPQPGVDRLGQGRHLRSSVTPPPRVERREVRGVLAALPLEPGVGVGCRRGRTRSADPGSARPRHPARSCGGDRVGLRVRRRPRSSSSNRPCVLEQRLEPRDRVLRRPVLRARRGSA